MHKKIRCPRPSFGTSLFHRNTKRKKKKNIPGSILLERRATKAATALELIAEALREGFSIIAFPEGTRGDPGVIQPFKSGIGKMAVDFQELPVYPVFLSGIEKTLPRGGNLPVPFCINLVVKPPIFDKDFLHLDPSPARKQCAARFEEIIRQTASKEANPTG
jgi:1-acyl-sn-glycerol-3-phosphate acyltransferase